MTNWLNPLDLSETLIGGSSVNCNQREKKKKNQFTDDIDESGNTD